MDEVLYTQSVNRASARFWDLPSATLLSLAILVATQRLDATGWTPGLGLVSLMTILAVLIGLPLGWSRFQPALASLLAVLYTLVAIPFSLAWLLYPELPWLDRMAAIAGRLGASFGVLRAGQPLEDALPFLAFFLLAFWCLGLYSAFSLTRAASFPASILPPGIALVLIQVFDIQGDRGVIFLAVFLFLAIFLLGRLNYARRQVSWKAWRVFSSGEARTNINVTVLAGAFLLVALAWALPVSQRSIPPLREWWQDVNKAWQESKGLDNVVAGLETNERPAVNDFYGKNLVLGQDAAQSDALLFRVQVTGLGGQERYYWRVRSYDSYINGLWQTEAALARSFSPRTRSLELPGYEGLFAEFVFHVDGTTVGSLITPARPIWVSRPSILTFLPAQDDQLEPLLFRANDPIYPGEEYLVHAILIEPTVKQLAEAGTEYPAWVQENYLQLPSDLPPAIVDLALQVTTGSETPYEKAVAVTDYLRKTITYAGNVPPAPTGRDTLAWFLLDYQAGFCNYYATAEVVMLRAVGVPARLVVGFAQGEYEAPGWYNVRQRDAHAWPEVYFPGQGWVEFEPTSAQPELVRPSGEEPTPVADATSLPVTPQAGGPLNIPAESQGSGIEPGDGVVSGSSGGTLAMLMVFFAVVILLGGLLAWAYISGTLEKFVRYLRSVFHAPLPILARDWLEKNSLPVPAWIHRQAWQAGLSPLARSFMAVYHSLRRMGLPASSSLTPAEAAAALQACLPQAGHETALLLAEYQSQVYGTTTASLDQARQAARHLLRKARRAAWQKLFTKRPPSPGR